MDIKTLIDRIRTIIRMCRLIRDTQTNKLVMTPIALLCTQKSRAPNIKVNQKVNPDL